MRSSSSGKESDNVTTAMSVLENFATRKEIFRVDEKCSYWISPAFDVSIAFVICVLEVIVIVLLVEIVV